MSEMQAENGEEKVSKKTDGQFHLPGHDTAWRIPLWQLKEHASVWYLPQRKVFHWITHECPNARMAKMVHIPGMGMASRWQQCTVAEAEQRGLRPCRRCMLDAWEEFDMSLAKNVLAIEPVKDPKLSAMLGLLIDGDII